MWVVGTIYRLLIQKERVLLLFMLFIIKCVVKWNSDWITMYYNNNTTHGILK